MTIVCLVKGQREYFNRVVTRIARMINRCYHADNGEKLVNTSLV